MNDEHSPDAKKRSTGDILSEYRSLKIAYKEAEAKYLRAKSMCTQARGLIEKGELDEDDPNVYEAIAEKERLEADLREIEAKIDRNKLEITQRFRDGLIDDEAVHEFTDIDFSRIPRKKNAGRF